jgi:hypothetical protein
MNNSITRFARAAFGGLLSNKRLSQEESERVPVAPFHRKSTSFEEAILRVESIITPEVPHEK